MPTNKNALIRYKILDELLSDRYHKRTLDEIVEEVNDCLAGMDYEAVTRRCIEKDLQFLQQDPFFVELEKFVLPRQKGGKVVSNRGVCYADSSFSIFKKDLTNEEEYLLKQALSLLGQFDGLPEFNGLEGWRRALNVSHDEPQIVSFTRNPLENTNMFARVFSVISHRQVVRITYSRSFDKTNKADFILHPYLLKEYNRRWYLFGATDVDGEIHIFALDRIDAVEPLSDRRFKPCDCDLEEWFEDIVGVTKVPGHPVLHIEFWVSDFSKDYVLTKPVHDSQIHYRGDDDMKFRQRYPHLQHGAFFSIDCMENYELVRELTSFGKDLLVLSPQSLRDEIVERLNKMWREYDKLEK